jgi:hypothetical protein
MIHFIPPPSDPQEAPPKVQLDQSRWNVLCKAAAAIAVEDGYLTQKEACDLTGMDPEALQLWRTLVTDEALRRILPGRL